MIVSGYEPGAVETDVATVSCDDPGAETDAGANVPDAPVSENATVPVKPASGVTETAKRPLAPCAMLAEPGVTATAKSGRSTTRADDVAEARTPFTFSTVVRIANVPVAA